MMYVEESLVEIGFWKQEVVRRVWKLTKRISCYNLEKKRMKSYYSGQQMKMRQNDGIIYWLLGIWILMSMVVDVVFY